jgi:hypothetical protein
MKTVSARARAKSCAVIDIYSVNSAARVETCRAVAERFGAADFIVERRYGKRIRLEALGAIDDGTEGGEADFEPDVERRGNPEQRIEIEPSSPSAFDFRDARLTHAGRLRELCLRPATRSPQGANLEGQAHRDLRRDVRVATGLVPEFSGQ